MAKAKNKPVKKGVAKGSQSANLKNTPHTDEFMDEIVQKHEELQTTGAGGNFFSMKKAGDYELRLLTFEDKDGKKHLFAPYMSHFIKRANKSFNCLGGVKSCPICRYIAWVEFKEGTQTDFTKNAKAREKFYVNALDMAGNEVQLDLTANAMKAITAIFANKKYGNIADEKTGRNITITRSGEGLDTEYRCLPDPEISPIKLKNKPRNLFDMVKAKTPSKQTLIDFVEQTFDVQYEELFAGGEGVDEKDDLPF